MPNKSIRNLPRDHVEISKMSHLLVILIFVFFLSHKSDRESLEVSQNVIYEVIRIYAECHLHLQW